MSVCTQHHHHRNLLYHHSCHRRPKTQSSRRRELLTLHKHQIHHNLPISEIQPRTKLVPELKKKEKKKESRKEREDARRLSPSSLADDPTAQSTCTVISLSPHRRYSLNPRHRRCLWVPKSATPKPSATVAAILHRCQSNTTSPSPSHPRATTPQAAAPASAVPRTARNRHRRSAGLLRATVVPVVAANPTPASILGDVLSHDLPLCQNKREERNELKKEGICSKKTHTRVN
ncbi:hypothetical protein M0R45_005032 [Rubus argutus]|uniref:Uncharacterized protein n=1 Tax=Rubus argutus TaxID=59490 RepID=A0AAW1YLK1_RUBAR